MNEKMFTARSITLQVINGSEGCVNDIVNQSDDEFFRLLRYGVKDLSRSCKFTIFIRIPLPSELKGKVVRVGQKIKIPSLSENHVFLVKEILLEGSMDVHSSQKSLNFSMSEKTRSTIITTHTECQLILVKHLSIDYFFNVILKEPDLGMNLTRLQQLKGGTFELKIFIPDSGFISLIQHLKLAAALKRGASFFEKSLSTKSSGKSTSSEFPAQLLADGKVISLRVKDAKPRDEGRGKVRLDKASMNEIGISTGDVVLITGERTTCGIAWPAYIEDQNKEIIRIDWIIRYNARVSLEELVTVRKVSPKIAQTVVLYDEKIANHEYQINDYVKRKLLGYPVVEGDLVLVTILGRETQSVVVETVPKGCVIIGDTTEVVFKETNHWSMILSNLVENRLEGKKISAMNHLLNYHPEIPLFILKAMDKTNIDRLIVNDENLKTLKQDQNRSSDALTFSDAWADVFANDFYFRSLMMSLLMMKLVSLLRVNNMQECFTSGWELLMRSREQVIGKKEQDVFFESILPHFLERGGMKTSNDGDFQAQVRLDQLKVELDVACKCRDFLFDLKMRLKAIHGNSTDPIFLKSTHDPNSIKNLLISQIKEKLSNFPLKIVDDLIQSEEILIYARYLNPLVLQHLSHLRFFLNEVIFQMKRDLPLLLPLFIEGLQDYVSHVIFYLDNYIERIHLKLTGRQSEDESA